MSIFSWNSLSFSRPELGRKCMQSLCSVPGSFEDFHSRGHRWWVLRTYTPNADVADPHFHATVIFIFRLYSLYGGSLLVLGSISALLVAEIAVKIVSARSFSSSYSTLTYTAQWAFTDGTRLVLPPGSYNSFGINEEHTNLHENSHRPGWLHPYWEGHCVSAKHGAVNHSSG